MLLTRMIYDDTSFDRGERTWNAILMKYKKKRNFIYFEIERVSRVFSSSRQVCKKKLSLNFSRTKNDKVREWWEFLIISSRSSNLSFFF